MTANNNPTQNHTDLSPRSNNTELPEAKLASTSALEALNKDFLNTIFSNPNGNAQGLASFDSRSVSNNDANSVNTDGSLNLDSTELFKRTETKAEIAEADAEDPDASLDNLSTDESKLERSIYADLDAAALFTGKGNFAVANHLREAASDAERALSDVGFAEKNRANQA